jgi:hypothetical protein
MGSARCGLNVWLSVGKAAATLLRPFAYIGARVADRGPMAYLWSVLDALAIMDMSAQPRAFVTPSRFLSKAGEVTPHLCKHSAPYRLQGEQNRLALPPAAESRL